MATKTHQPKKRSVPTLRKARPRSATRHPDTAAQWDAIAAQWDDVRKTPSAVLSLFPQANGTVMDAGCGSGRHSAALAKFAKRVVALDASKKMLALAKNNLVGRSNVEFVHAALPVIPLESATLDATYCLAALHHVPPGEHANAFAEFFRTLKPGGTLHIAAWNGRQKRFRDKGKEQDVPWQGKPRYYYFFGADELQTLAQDAGFRDALVFFEKDGHVVGPDDADNVCLTAAKPAKRRARVQ